MDFLNKLGGVQSRTFGHLTDLDVGEQYLIDQWITMTTRYGRRTAILIGSVQYTLPYRFHKLSDEDVAKYNEKQISITFKGTKKFGSYQETAILEFVEM